MPQLMGVEGIGADLWRQVQMIPSILHRISSILAAKNLLVRLGCSPLPHSDLHLPQVFQTRQTFENLIEPDRDDGWPNPWHILEAVTLAKAEDVMNMECLEVLGDGFLKFSTSVFLYYKSMENREDFYRKDEGELSMERSRIVSNRHLFDLAIKLGLEQIVVERKLEPSVSWQPPGFSRQALENILIDLDTRFPSLVDVANSNNLGGGSLLNWLRPEDLELLESSEEEDQAEKNEILLSRAVERLNKKEASELILRSHKLISDKSLADCMEALIGAFLVHSGPKMTHRWSIGPLQSLNSVLQGDGCAWHPVVTKRLS